MNNKDEIIVEIKKPVKKNKKKKKIKKVSDIKKVRKEQNKVRKIAIKIFLAIIIVIILSIIFASSEIFNVKEISVLGKDKLSENEVISFSQIKFGENIFKINFSKVEGLIKENPYVEDVLIKRVLPNKVEITIDERKVKYMLQLAESYIYIDGQGYILEISKEKKDVPILLGILTDLSNIEPTDRLNKEDLIKLNTINNIVVTAQSYEILNLITKIDITNSSEYILYLENEGKQAYIGNASDLANRILWLKAIMEENKNSSGKIFVNMDLNARKPYFRSEN